MDKQLIETFLNGRWILVIDPSANYRDSLKRFIANLGVKRVKVVSNPKDAQRELITKKVGLFIVEWQLDFKNGLEFCRDLRNSKQYADAAFLLLAAESLQKSVILASEVLIDGYLVKPFSYQVFCDKVESMFRARLNPNPINSILVNAEIAHQAGDVLGAEKHYNEALDIERSARPLCGLGRIEEERGQLESARKLYQEASEANPMYLDSWRGLISVAQALNDSDAVTIAATKAHEISPDNPKYTLILALGYLMRNMLAESETFFKKTIHLSPKLADGYKGLGDVYMKMEEFDLATKNYKKALDLEKNDLSTLNSLGLAYVRMGKVEDGIAKYRLALQLDPTDPRVLFNLGYAYEKLNRLTEAESYYQQALKLRPDYIKALRRVRKMKSAS